MSDLIVSLAKLLLRTGDDVDTAEALVRQVIEVTGAERGFVVARSGEHFVPKFAHQIDVHADDDGGRFSRSLVRTAIARGRPIYSTNPAEDPDLSHVESLASADGRAVLVVPLGSGEERFGALYLEHRGAAGFDEAARGFVVSAAELAGLALQRAIERTELARRARALEEDLLARFDFAGVVTRSPEMRAALQTVAQVADAKASVLILGESGTGKELVARALHVNGQRRRAPYVTVHCAALPTSMLESELFGHVRGAFTGAERERAGRIASADGGTLFLDEIGELPLDVQAKLLRVVQFGELQRVGADRVDRVDVRIVAATHRDLRAMVDAGTFRQDLYYRLHVIEVRVPPLRERPEDVAPLVDHFLAAAGPRGAKRFTAGAMAHLEAHVWPGNVRELAHVVERAVLLASGPEIDESFLSAEVRSSVPPRSIPSAARARTGCFAAFTKAELELELQRAVEATEIRFLEGLLERHGGNVSRAALASGIRRTQIQRMMARRRGSSDPARPARGPASLAAK